MKSREFLKIFLGVLFFAIIGTRGMYANDKVFSKIFVKKNKITQ